MERNRETRRLNTPSMNGGAASSRRRQNNTDEGAVEAAENSRLRERPGKRDRDRDRSGRTKRRRGERIVHSSSREDADDTSDDTLDDEEEDEDDDVTASIQHSQYNQNQNQNHNQNQQQMMQRKSFPFKVGRPPRTSWKADEMLGVAVPRKARSVAPKRPDSWSSAGDGGGRGGGSGIGGDEPMTRQASVSPSRMSPASATQISPSSSNASGRKKLKPSSGSKHRPPRTGKPAASSLVQDEIEVAEVLFGLTRQFQSHAKQESQKVDDYSGNESKSRVLSPGLMAASHVGESSAALSSNPVAVGPKRKRPRKIEDESPSSSAGVPPLQSTSISSSAKSEQETQLKAEVLLPKQEKINESLRIPSGPLPNAVETQMKNDQLESPETEVKGKNQVPETKPVSVDTIGAEQFARQEIQEATVAPAKGNIGLNLDGNSSDGTKANGLLESEKTPEAKFTFDLMALPSEKLSPDGADICNSDADTKVLEAKTGTEQKIGAEKEEREKVDESLGHVPLKELDLKLQEGKETSHGLQFDLEKVSKDNIDGNKIHCQKQQKASHPEPKLEKPAQTTALSRPMIVAGWPGTFPPFGYPGQVPPVQLVLPPDGSSGSSTILLPPNLVSPQNRPKRCATHCYIAQKIFYNQRAASMSPLWSAAAGTIPLYGAKQYGLNAVPASDSALLGNTMQGNFLPTNLGSKDDKEVAVTTATGQSSKDVSSSGNALPGGTEKKQLVLQQSLQSGSPANVLHGPAFIFPVNQQQAAAAVTSMAATASGGPRSAPGFCDMGSTSASTSSVNMTFAGIAPNDAQYLALLQNSGYPFPIPANVAATPQQYRGITPTGTVPFFSAPFYSTQMLHPSQLQQQQPTGPPTSHSQQSVQNATTSGSSSSMKHQQFLGRGPNATVGSSHVQPEIEKGSSDHQVTADVRVPQTQKNAYGNNFHIPIGPPNYTLISSASSAPISIGGGQIEKQHGSQHQQQVQQKPTSKGDIAPSQLFAMPFTSFNGVVPPGLDISSMAQNGLLLQTLPDAIRQQYNHLNMPAATSTVRAAQQKTPNRTIDDGASASRTIRNSNGKSIEDRKAISSASKVPGNSSQLTLTFSRPDETTISDSSSKNLNLGNNSAPAAVTSGTASMNVSNPHQLVQLHKQQQNQLLMHSSLTSQSPSRSKLSTSNSNPGVYNSERLPSGMPVAKFSQAMSAFPQAVIQPGGSNQTPQWKSNARVATASSGSQPAVSKSSLPPQQGRVAQQSLHSQSHQNQISFGANMMKAVPSVSQLHPNASNNQSSSSGNLPQNSVLKSSTVSPQASAGAKPGLSPPVMPLTQQSSSPKISPSNSSQKSSLLNNRKATSITGQPNVTPNSGAKVQQHQLPQQPQHAASQLFFMSGFMQQAHTSQSNAVVGAAAGAARFYPRTPESQPKQQQLHQRQSQQQTSPSVEIGHAMPASSQAPATIAANSVNMNGIPAPSLLHAVAQSGPPNALMLTTLPYMSVSPKATAEQKPAANE